MQSEGSQVQVRCVKSFEVRGSQGHGCHAWVNLRVVLYAGEGAYVTRSSKQENQWPRN